MFTETELLTHIIGLNRDLTQIQDEDVLLPRILSTARAIVHADAGSLYVRHNNELVFAYSQNDTLGKNAPAERNPMQTARSLPIDNYSIAGYVAANAVTLNIPDAYAIPPGKPYWFDQCYDDQSRYRTRSIVACPLITPQHTVLGVLQLINALDNRGRVTAFSPADEPYLLHFAGAAAVALDRTQMTRTLILRMLRMAEMRDPLETGAHVNRVGACAAVIYEAWAIRQGLRPPEITRQKDILRLAAMLHDVGKVAVPDSILKKPGKLDTHEYDAIKQHTLLGAQLFADIRSDFDRAAFHIALEHHERWDGTGYPGIPAHAVEAPLPADPRGCSPGEPIHGERIHPFARVTSIADVYDALSSRRSYKQAWDESEVLRQIKDESGRQFDPEVVRAFLEVFDQVRAIREQYPDSN